MANEKRLIDRNKIFPNGIFVVNAEDPLKSLDELIARIRSIPTVDAVEVVHGRWMKTCLADIYHCTNCKKATKMDELCDSKILRAYCPNCGADMRERKDDA